MTTLLSRVRGLLDPDTNWRSWSTIQHFLSGCILCIIITSTGAGAGLALKLNLGIAIVYEAGQTDAAYNIKDGSGQRWAGRPGFGFGLMDIAAHMLGSMSWLLVSALIGLVL